MVSISDIMILFSIYGNTSENIILCINTLQAQDKLFSKVSYYFSCFFAVTGKKLLPLYPDTSDECWVIGDGGFPLNSNLRFRSVVIPL